MYTCASLIINKSLKDGVDDASCGFAQGMDMHREVKVRGQRHAKVAYAFGDGNRDAANSVIGGEPV